MNARAYVLENGRFALADVTDKDVNTWVSSDVICEVQP